MKILIMNHIEMILKYEIQFFFVKINFILIKKKKKKIHNKKSKWHSESKLTELFKESPRLFHRQTLVPTSSLPSMPDRNEQYFYQEPGTERKVNSL